MQKPGEHDIRRARWRPYRSCAINESAAEMMVCQHDRRPSRPPDWPIRGSATPELKDPGALKLLQPAREHQSFFSLWLNKTFGKLNHGVFSLSPTLRPNLAHPQKTRSPYLILFFIIISYFYIIDLLFISLLESGQLSAAAS
jgi:hypothetical protein